MTGRIDGHDGAVLRPEIAQSWRRAELAGLDPSLPLHRLSHQQFDRRSRLIRAATPVLDTLAENLAGTTFSVLLADRDARLVARRAGQSAVQEHLDALGVTAGRVFTEDNSGTNALATAHELRRGVAVVGAEHYIEALKGFSCYGHPIMHPATGRLDGVLDITCPADEATPLLKPFLLRAVRDIEHMLLEDAREAERRLMAAFQEAAARRGHPVLVLGEDVVLANPAAVELLEPADHATLRQLAAELPRSSLTHCMTLPSGRDAEIRIEPVAGTGGAVFSFASTVERRAVPRGAPEDTTTRLRRLLAGHRERRDRVLLGGEPGTGRSYAARVLAGDAAVAELDGTAAETFEAELPALLARHDGLILLENIHLLPAAVAVRVMRLIVGSAAWVAATCAPPRELGPDHAALAACFPARVELPALRARRTELPGLIRDMLAAVDPDASVRATPRTLQVLSAHPWPGNLHELRSVVEEILGGRSAGDITPEDIPAGYRGSAAGRTLTPIEQIEHDAIAQALRACGGNKVHAAEQLGMSRSTFYRRLRTLGVSV